MVHHIISLAGGDSQSIHGMGPFQDSASEGLKPDPHENKPNLLTIMWRDIRSALLSMLATLKLLNRGYYGKMDEEVANKIKDLLSSATRLTGIAEECLGGTFAGDEETEIVGANGVMEYCELNAPKKQLSTETKIEPFILYGNLKDGDEDQNPDHEMADSTSQIKGARRKGQEGRMISQPVR